MASTEPNDFLKKGFFLIKKKKKNFFNKNGRCKMWEEEQEGCLICISNGEGTGRMLPRREPWLLRPLCPRSSAPQTLAASPGTQDKS